jgi:putative drug exporter of the RND superfamily
VTLFSTRRLARACDRHPWRTIGLWGVVLVLSIAAIVTLLGSGITTDADVTAETESQRGYDLIAERLPNPDYVDEVIVVRSEELTVDDARFEALASDLVPEEAARIVGSPRPSADRHALLIPIQLREDPSDRIEQVIDAVRAADDDPAFDVAVTGEFTIDRDFTERSQRDLEEGELYFGLPAALIVLVLVFGAVVAGLIPVLLALVSIVVALALTALVGQISPLSFFVVNMISGMGLALGIDYALFIVSRYREERRHGRSKLEAIEASGATSGRAVFISGVVFVVSMVGMVLVPDTILRSLAVGAILVGVASVATALTLLPAVLSVLGDKVNALRVPIIGKSAQEGTDREGRVSRLVVGSVMRRPALWLAAVAALLLAAAAPVVTMNFGLAGVSTLSDDFESKRGFLALQRDFAAGQTDPVLVVVDGDVSSGAARDAVAELRRRMAALGVFGDSAVRAEPDRRIAVVSAPVRGDPARNQARDTIRDLRDDVVPQTFAGGDAEVLVTGLTAEQVDYSDLIADWLPIVFGFVLVVSFVLLTVVFRSFVVAATAIVLNLLSVGAAYGLLVLVFQHGVGADLFGFRQVDTVEAWVPLFLFSVLFGLSMDYHVFIVSRIREGYLATGRNDDSVAHGVAASARLITGAALIIIVVFAGFAMGELVMFQQMGFGIAVALLIDATLVRTILLPAAMKLLGAWNWYLPRWLRWLPRLEIETAGRS